MTDIQANELRAGVSEDQASAPYPVPIITSIKATGLVEVSFSKPMLEIPANIQLKGLEYKVSRFEWAPVISVKVIPSPLQNPEKLNFDWHIENYTSMNMVI